MSKKPNLRQPEKGIEGLTKSLPIDEESMFLTERQATVLLCRERGLDQGTIAKYLSCSRANISNIERSARRNIEKAHQTIEFDSLISSPVHVILPAGLALHEVPELVFSVSDDAGVKVNHGAPEVIRKVTDAFPSAEKEGVIVEELVVAVSPDGSVRIMAST